MTAFSDIFAENAANYKHLSFGEANVAGVVFIREEFQIPADEEILVFAPVEQSGKNGSSLGVVITDGALYVHPQVVLSFHENRIPLPDLCNYLFFQEDSYDAVHAMSQKEDRVIFPKLSGMRNENGRELFRLLKTFQANLLSVNSKLSHAYDLALGAAISHARNCFSEHGVLTVRAQTLLNLVENEGKFPVDVAYIRAENLYRLSDMARYYQFVEELAGTVNEDLIKRLKNPDEVFFDEFVKDISNPYSLFLTQDLLPSYANLRRLPAETLNDFQIVILCYLCVRTDDDLYLHKLFSEQGRAIGEKHLWEICAFQARFKNEKMAGIYNRILSDANVSSIEQKWTDALGLTALHYAMLLRNRGEVTRILNGNEKVQDWSDIAVPEDYAVDDDLKTLYDFSFLASIVFDQPSDIREIFVHTSHLAKPILKVIASLEQKIYINQELGREDEVFELRQKKRDMEVEIETLCEAFTARAKKRADKIRSEGSPYAKFLLGVYENNDALFSILTGTIADYRVYRFGNRFFVANDVTELPFSFYEWKDQSFSTKKIHFGDERYVWTERERLEYESTQKKQDEEPKRKYHKYSFTGDDGGDSYFYEDTISYREPQSWFSSRAHSDPDLLKKEYRLLVKKYHPDNSDIPQAKLILQQITSERERIVSAKRW